MKEKIFEYVKHYVRLYGLSTLYLATVGFICGSVFTFRSHDLSFFYHARYGTCTNMFGWLGATLSAALVYAFGSGVYLFLVLLGYLTLFVFGFQSWRRDSDRLAGAVLLTGSSTLFCNLYQVGLYEFSSFGGALGRVLTESFAFFSLQAKLFILYGIVFVSSVLLLRFAHLIVARYVLITAQVVTDYVLEVDHLPARIVRSLATGVYQVSLLVYRGLHRSFELLTGSFVKESTVSVVEFERDEPVDKNIEELVQDLLSHPQDQTSKHATMLENHFAQQEQQEQLEQLESELKKQDFVTRQYAQQEGAQESQEVVIDHAVQVDGSYQLPDIDEMLSRGDIVADSAKPVDASAFDEQSAILEEKLSLFGVKGNVVRVHPGPVITLFEYRPDNNIKLSKILGLEDDLAMALQAVNIRILAPIPGKAVVGFEVANKNRKPVLLADIFHSPAWTQFDGSLPLIVGENTQGERLVLDLASMPHLLIAGSTGSGKSVALNCMLISLLCAKDPEQVKLIIIDPKQLEFSAYEDIAHLLFPIVTDSKKAVPVLKWLVSTMEERYEIMSEHGVKNIFEYQKLAEQRSDLEEMPFIVLIIDELADLMMTTGKDIEDLIARIAQMSRAAGIHMIVATQRPSVDVITGLIKVNFPNRMSFKVTSKVDSRTILDVMGAERLLGKGDMLFIDSKDPDLKRAHGAYVSNREIEFLVNHIKDQKLVEYLDLSDFLVSDKNPALLDADQDLYRDIVELLQNYDEVSISMIQRKFRIGYNRSARIIETLEADGHILPSDGSKMRKVIKQ